MDDLYREIIIDRYKNPLYRGTLDPHDISFEDDNPLCGDHIRIDLRLDEDAKVSEATFDGHGCAISQATADLLGIELGPVRLKCALLSLKVLKAGVYGLGEATDELVE
jgi:nitrogen fixation NifU-like protein